MRFPPLSVLLSWPPADYTNPPTHGPALLIVMIVFITLVCIAVAGRLYSRLVVKQWFGADDSVMVFAWICTVGMTVVVILANERYGWNRHVWDLEAEMIAQANKIAFVAKIMFTLAATLTRISLICFYHRLVKDSGIKCFSWVLHLAMAWTVAVCITFLCEVIWLCIPIHAYWEFPPTAPSHCLDEGKVMLSGGVINCISDLLTTVLPIPIVARLQMPLRQRVGVCVLLCLGLVVTIAGVVRTYFIWKSLLDSYDETWYAYPLWIAATIEIDLAVICACAPAWKSLVQQPIRDVASLVGSKLSSLRSPQSSRAETPTPGPGLRFSPLRSLPWFQITTMEFERSSRARRSQTGLEVEEGRAMEAGQEAREMVQISRDRGSRSLRHSQIVLDDDAIDLDARPNTPTLMILKRQSFGQESTYMHPCPRPARRSIGRLLPGQWLGEKSAAMKKLLPRQ